MTNSDKKRTRLRLALELALRRLLFESEGQEIAEAAAVLPLMFMILLGIFWFGQAFSIYGTIARAAQEAAIAGSEPVCTTCPTGNSAGQNAYNAAVNVLNAASMSTASPPLHQPTAQSLQSCTVGQPPPGCDTNPATMCVQEGVQLSSTTTGAAGVCGISVTIQYNYQFWLPFTSLNQQLIPIRASAQVPMETR
ncbi:MAG TPA: TadE family protein [Verrucomicrobiae bacterium]|jgi:hypothetical protein|nr:TadE family protein [Verrucomicrobiae bacterium]